MLTKRLWYTHVQKIAELIVLGRDEADPARRVLVLSAVLNVHLQERGEALEKVSEAGLVRQRGHPTLVSTETPRTISGRWRVV